MMTQINHLNSNPLANGREMLIQKKGNVPAVAEFSGELAQAGVEKPVEKEKSVAEKTVANEKVQIGMDVQASGIPQVIMPPVASPISLPNMAGELAGRAQKSEVKEGVRSSLQSSLHSSVDQSPLTMKSAAGLNTGAAIAGLKPWSKDWVFQGRGEASNSVKPLFDFSSEAETQLPAAAQNPSASAVNSKTPEGEKNLSLDQLPQSAPANAPLNRDDVLRVMGGNANLASPQEVGQDLGQISRQDLGNAIAADATMYGLDDSMRIDDSQVQSPKAQVHVLSGGEFLNALNAVQDGQNGSGSGRSGDRSGGQSGFSGGSRPQELQGILKSKKGRIGEPMTIPVEPGVVGLYDRPKTLRPMEVTGHVTQGAMTRERLSSESLLGVTHGIRNLTSQGGGEIRVRLKPDNLGELNLRVMTRGNSVGIQIQATDERAKKIIEESMVHLKESLATQNLQLGRVDLSVAQTANSAAGGDLRNDQGQQNNHDFRDSRDMMGQNMNQGSHQSFEGRSDQWRGVANDGYSLDQPGVRTQTVGQSTKASSGRLDVTA